MQSIGRSAVVEFKKEGVCRGKRYKQESGDEGFHIGGCKIEVRRVLDLPNMMLKSTP